MSSGESDAIRGYYAGTTNTGQGYATGDFWIGDPIPSTFPNTAPITLPYTSTISCGPTYVKKYQLICPNIPKVALVECGARLWGEIGSVVTCHICGYKLYVVDRKYQEIEPYYVGDN